MLKKLFVTATAAAAVSFPLAGAAWADPPSDGGSNGTGTSAPGSGGNGTSEPGSAGNGTSSPGSNGNGIGAGGLPAKTGELDAALGAGDGSPTTVGSAVSQAAKEPGTNAPEAVGNLVTEFFEVYGPPNGLPAYVYGPTPPGLQAKNLTPGCGHGHGSTSTPPSGCF